MKLKYSLCALVSLSGLCWQINAPADFHVFAKNTTLPHTTAALLETSLSKGHYNAEKRIGANAISDPERTTATQSFSVFSSKDDKVDAKFKAVFKGDHRIFCEYHLSQKPSWMTGTDYKLVDSSDTYQYCTVSCSITHATNNPNCHNYSTHAHGGTGYITASVQEPTNYPKPTDLTPTASAPKLTAIPILTSDGSTYYRIRIHGGSAPAFDYFSPTTNDQATKPIADDPYPGHFHITFTPYTIYQGDAVDNTKILGRVIPIATVHLDYSDRLVNLPQPGQANSFLYQTPVSLLGDTEFFYKPSATNNQITVSQSVVQTLVADREGKWSVKPWSQLPKATIKLDGQQDVSAPDDLTASYQIKLSSTGTSTPTEGFLLYGNALNQVKINVSIENKTTHEPIEQVEKDYNALYSHVYFKIKTGIQDPYIATNFYQPESFSAVSSVPGPYAISPNAAPRASLKRSVDNSHNYFVSAWAPSGANTYTVQAFVCVKKTGETTPECLSSTELKFTTKKSDLDKNKVAAGYIQFNHPLAAITTNNNATTPQAENSGPMFVDQNINSGDNPVLNYPLIYGLPNYAAKEIPALLQFNGTKINPVYKLSDPHISQDEVLHLNVVDLYGNGYAVGETNEK